MKQEFEQRCRIFEDCMPEGRARMELIRLHAEMLREIQAPGLDGYPAMDLDNTGDPNDPGSADALELATKFSRHCKLHNLPISFVIAGVTPNANALSRDAYARCFRAGKDEQLEQIAEALDLTASLSSRVPGFLDK